MSIIKKMPDVQNLRNTGRAFLDLPLGMTYNALICKLSGTTFTRAHITGVNILLNGKPFWRNVPASIIQAINLYRDSENDAAFLMLDFEEARSRTMEEQKALTIGTAAGVNSFKVEFEIAGATNPMIEVWAVQSAPKALGPVPAIIRDSEDFTSTGDKSIRWGYTPSARHIIKRAHFVLSGGLTLGDVTLYKNGVPIFDRVPADVNEFLQKHFEGIPQANIFTVDFVEDNNTIINLLPTEDANSLYWELDVTAPGHLDIYYELVSPLETV